MTDPSPELIRAAWAFMAPRFGATLVNKADASEMKLIASSLDAFGIVDKRAFLARYVTTLATRVYIPFEIGVPSPGWSLWAQLSTLCAHELMHVHDWNLWGIYFAAGYLLSPAQRAHYEMRAYRASFEMHYWRYKSLPVHGTLTDHLSHGYGVPLADCTRSEDALALSWPSVQRGDIVSPTCALLIPWLEARPDGLALRAA